MKNNRERYEDYKSTGFLFIPFGIIGIAYTLLDYFDIIKFTNFVTNLFQFCVITIMFVIFIAIGVSSLITANKLKASADEQDDIISKVNAYIKDNLTDDYIKRCADNNGLTDTNDADSYYVVVESFTNDLKNEFADVDEDLLSELTGNYYNENF